MRCDDYVVKPSESKSCCGIRAALRRFDPVIGSLFTAKDLTMNFENPNGTWRTSSHSERLIFETLWAISVTAFASQAARQLWGGVRRRDGNFAVVINQWRKKIERIRASKNIILRTVGRLPLPAQKVSCKAYSRKVTILSGVRL